MGKTLLLTATISPPANAVKLARTDPRARLRDYLQALEFYLALPEQVVGRIVFVENSASDLSDLRQLAARFPNREIDFISFSGLDYSPKFGRAYGESRLLDYAMAQAGGILSRLPPHEPIWKVTGRLRLTNIGQMMRGAPPIYDMYCDMRNRPAHWMEMRVYAFTRHAYRHILMGIAERLREDLHNTLAAETLIYDHIMEYADKMRIVPRFRTQPIIAGISGFANHDYSHGLANNLKTATRMVLRKVAPRLWV
ncbi:MAG TPA: hypothetical protein VH370_17050 [Humisphaera sp.]|nr:hypothetical protein [Humisphaera sp.]